MGPAQDCSAPLPSGSDSRSHMPTYFFLLLCQQAPAQPADPSTSAAPPGQAKGGPEGVNLEAMGIDPSLLGDITKTYKDWDAQNKKALDIQVKLDTVR